MSKATLRGRWRSGLLGRVQAGGVSLLGKMDPPELPKSFSENGVSVAAMCAESYQYRPLLCQLGGVRQNRQNTNLVPLLLASCLLDRSLRH